MGLSIWACLIFPKLLWLLPFSKHGKGKVKWRKEYFPKMCQCQGSTRCLHSWRNQMWAFTTSSAVFWQTYWLDMRFSQCSRVCSPLISDSKQTKSPFRPNSPLLHGINKIMLLHIKSELLKSPLISHQPGSTNEKEQNEVWTIKNQKKTPGSERKPNPRCK